MCGCEAPTTLRFTSYSARAVRDAYTAPAASRLAVLRRRRSRGGLSSGARPAGVADLFKI